MAQAGFEPGSVAPESTPFPALSSPAAHIHEACFPPQPEDEPGRGTFVQRTMDGDLEDTLSVGE